MATHGNVYPSHRVPIRRRHGGYAMAVHAYGRKMQPMLGCGMDVPAGYRQDSNRSER